MTNPNTVTVCAICELVPAQCNGHRGTRADLVRNPDGTLRTKEVLYADYKARNDERARLEKRWEPYSV